MRRVALLLFLAWLPVAAADRLESLKARAQDSLDLYSIVSQLVEAGIDAGDAQARALHYSEQTISCAFDAAVTEGIKVGLSEEEVLDALSAELDTGERDETLGFATADWVETHLGPCSYNAAQEAGIPLP